MKAFSNSNLWAHGESFLGAQDDGFASSGNQSSTAGMIRRQKRLAAMDNCVRRDSVWFMVHRRQDAAAMSRRQCVNPACDGFSARRGRVRINPGMVANLRNIPAAFKSPVGSVRRPAIAPRFFALTYNTKRNV